MERRRRRRCEREEEKAVRMYVCAVEQSDDTQTRQKPDENRWRILYMQRLGAFCSNFVGGDSKCETLLITAKIIRQNNLVFLSQWKRNI